MDINKKSSTGRTLSIGTQLTAGIVIITLAGIGLISIFALKVIETRSVDAKVRQAVTFVELIRVAARHGSLAGMQTDVTGFVYAALKESAVEDFELKAPDGRVLLSSGVLPVGTDGAIYLSNAIKIYNIGGGFFKGPGKLLYVSARLDRATAAKGSLSFTLPMDDIRKEVAGVRQFLLLYAVIDSVIIILFGLYFFSRSITLPIKGLEKATARIASGAFDERADALADNELGRLAVSFNTMAARVETEIKALEAVNRELLSAQEDLLRTQTLAALGRMAAGIAHEVGNPLGAVLGYLEILGNGKTTTREDKDIVRRTTDEVLRIDKILREFLDVSRPSSTGITDTVDVNTVVEETIASLGANKEFCFVTVISTLASNLPSVRIDAGKLRQVFLNLLLNAAQSMEDITEDKVIIVTTSIEKAGINGLKEPFSRRKDDKLKAASGSAGIGSECIAISISDRGRGLDAVAAEKIFEPFFSTKEVGKGTGLGLFVTDMIIKANRGTVLFDSVPGAGSVFTVMLPAEVPVRKDER